MTNKEKRDRCLIVLTNLSFGGDEHHYFPFRSIVERTDLTYAEVRRAVRLLKRQGLAEFCSGLVNEDGDFAGSGYRCTKQGIAEGQSLMGDEYCIVERIFE